MAGTRTKGRPTIRETFESVIEELQDRHDRYGAPPKPLEVIEDAFVAGKRRAYLEAIRLLEIKLGKKERE